MFFALAVAGFNFAANLTAGVLLLNISQITNWQALQATVLHNFATLAPFAQILGIVGGLVTVLMLVPFLLTFIKQGLKQKNASTKAKVIPNDEDKASRLSSDVANNLHKKPQSLAEKTVMYFYEFLSY